MLWFNIFYLFSTFQYFFFVVDALEQSFGSLPLNCLLLQGTKCCVHIFLLYLFSRERKKKITRITCCTCILHNQFCLSFTLLCFIFLSFVRLFVRFTYFYASILNIENEGKKSAFCWQIEKKEPLNPNIIFIVCNHSHRVN